MPHMTYPRLLCTRLSYLTTFHLSKAYSMNSIEVERKFIPNEKFEETILSRGGKFLGCKTFLDKYYDVPAYKLSLGDHWLRKRNHVWELKCPVHSSSHKTPEEKVYTSKYQEVNKESDILDKIVKFLDCQTEETNQTNVDEFIQIHGLIVLAEFETKRKKYELRDVSIDIDQSSFGYHLAELEVMTSSEEAHLNDGLKKINDVSSLLGLTWSNRIPGKMSMYLKENKTELYDKLVALGICC